MEFYCIEPEVAGGHGPRTVYNLEKTPPEVLVLEYVFDDWLGDPLLESSPCFIVTRDLMEKMETSGMTGIEFSEVLTSVSSEGIERMDIDLPEWMWLKPIGVASVDDFGLSGNGAVLVVSSPALELLLDSGMSNADILALPQP
ncbi:hypothetical protein [Nocardia lasii]|uniref:Uncharacterized protein n=1 Tax=Nocardia lasii TaxID=1616107 RepID=A0ABW1JPJ3_9NOCA